MFSLASILVGRGFSHDIIAAKIESASAAEVPFSQVTRKFLSP
jgi:hypothetical protein